MKKHLIGLAVLCLATSLAAGEALAQRGRRGSAPRPGPGGAGAVTTPRRTPNPTTPPIRITGTNAAGPRFQPPAGARPSFSVRPQSIPTFLGTTRPPTAHPSRQNAFGWINPQHKPFTAAWYKAHPNAWRATHPHAPAAVAVTALGVARWLGAPYAATTNTTSGAAISEQPPVDETAEPVAAVADQAEWITIGEFALRPAGQAQATRVIQLAVSRNGAVGGSHYDLITEQVLDIQGTVDKSNLQVTWTVGAQGKVVFRTPLDELTRSQGKVTAQLPDGQTAAWQTVRVTP